MSARFAWERAVKSSDMSRARKAILLTLATHSNKRGEVWPSQATVAEESGYAERTVRLHLAEAVKDGWLERLRKGGHVGRNPDTKVTSKYALTTPGNRQVGDGSQDVGSGTPAPVHSWQPADSAWQPAGNGLATGTPLPPINNESIHESTALSSPLRENANGSDPFEREAFEEEETKVVIPLDLYEAAKKLGKQLASLTEDADAVDDQFNADRKLRTYPDLLRTVHIAWHAERIRIGLDLPQQVIR